MLIAKQASRYAPGRGLLAGDGLAPANLGWVPVITGESPDDAHKAIREPDGPVGRPSVFRLAPWIVLAERCYSPDGQPSPDCVLRSWGAFVALHERLSNSGTVDQVVPKLLNPTLDELAEALGGRFV